MIFSALRKFRNGRHLDIRKLSITAPSNYTVVSNEELVTEAEKLNGKKIFYFTAVWCPPCRMIAPIYEKMSKVITLAQQILFHLSFKFNRAARESNSIKSILTTLATWPPSTVLEAYQLSFSFQEMLF